MVPYRFKKEASVIAVFTSITGERGTRRIKLALDTGATYVMVPHHILESLGYDPWISKERVPITTASGVETVPLINVDSVSCLGKRVTNLKVACHDLPPSSRVDGLLGLSYLKHFKLTIDYARS